MGKLATCHPDRPAVARGLCRSCYNRQRRAEVRAGGARAVRRGSSYPVECPFCGQQVTSGGRRGYCPSCDASIARASPCVDCGTEEPGARSRGRCPRCYQSWYYRTTVLPKRRLAREQRGPRVRPAAPRPPPPLRVDEISITMEEVEELAKHRMRFSDWEAVGKAVPFAPGIYTVWRDDQLVFAGIAGTGKKGRGLRGHLAEHARGLRGRDKFSVQVFDHFVLPALTSRQIRAAAAGELSLDAVTAQFIGNELSFAVVPLDIVTAALVEQQIRAGGWRYGAPLLGALQPEPNEDREVDPCPMAS